MLYVIKRVILCSIFLFLAWFFYGMNYFNIHGNWSIWTDESISIIRFEARNDTAGYTDADMKNPADVSATIAKDTSFSSDNYTVVDGDTLNINGIYYPSSSFVVKESNSSKTTSQRLLMLIPFSLESGWMAIRDTITGKMSITRFMEPIAIPTNPFVWLFNIPFILLVIFYYRGFIARPWRYLGNAFGSSRRLTVFPVLLLFGLFVGLACFLSKNNFGEGLNIGDLQAVLSAGFALRPPGEVVEGLTAPRWIAVWIYWICKAFWVAFAVDCVRTYRSTKKFFSATVFIVINLVFCGLFAAAAISLANVLALFVFLIMTLLAVLFFFGQVGSILASHEETRYIEYTVTETVDNGFRRMDE